MDYYLTKSIQKIKCFDCNKCNIDWELKKYAKTIYYCDLCKNIYKIIRIHNHRSKKLYNTFIWKFNSKFDHNKTTKSQLKNENFICRIYGNNHLLNQYTITLPHIQFYINRFISCNYNTYPNIYTFAVNYNFMRTLSGLESLMSAYGYYQIANCDRIKACSKEMCRNYSINWKIIIENENRLIKIRNKCRKRSMDSHARVIQSAFSEFKLRKCMKQYKKNMDKCITEIHSHPALERTITENINALNEFNKFIE